MFQDTLQHGFTDLSLYEYAECRSTRTHPSVIGAVYKRRRYLSVSIYLSVRRPINVGKRVTKFIFYFCCLGCSPSIVGIHPLMNIRITQTVGCIMLKISTIVSRCSVQEHCSELRWEEVIHYSLHNSYQQTTRYA